MTNIVHNKVSAYNFTSFRDRLWTDRAKGKIVTGKLTSKCIIFKLSNIQRVFQQKE